MRKNDHPREETLHETPQQEEIVTAPQEEIGEACAAPADAALAAALERGERALAALKEKEDQFLRLAAEYENFRRRSQKEKETIWADAKFDTALAFLPVYDNLERALKLECSDDAYQKGVEMTMTQLKAVLAKLDVEEIPALGQPFDPAFHNAVMHVEDESAGKNTVVEVFQTGFQSGEKIIRFAMVKVAN
jgi:molecular chaperone GrpE